MNLKSENYHELAIDFLQDNLTGEKKEIVQQLVINDPEFLKALKIELTLKKQLETLKQPLSLQVRDRLYANITQERITVVYEQVVNTVLEATLPNMVWTVFKLLKRSVYVNEQQRYTC